jgi:hypothetical protein
VSAAQLSAPDLPNPTAHQCDDLLLDLRIVQQAQKHLLESLMLLGLLDLVFGFGSVFHRTIMRKGSSVERPAR